MMTMTVAPMVLLQDGGLSPLAWIAIIVAVVLLVWLFIWLLRSRWGEKPAVETRARSSMAVEKPYVPPASAEVQPKPVPPAAPVMRSDAPMPPADFMPPEAPVVPPASMPPVDLVPPVEPVTPDSYVMDVPATSEERFTRDSVDVPLAPNTADDLIIIEGIGPKIASVLNAAGITTFAALAAASPEDISKILLANNLRLADPHSWPAQARLAANGDMQGLKEMQDQLKGGRA